MIQQKSLVFTFASSLRCLFLGCIVMLSACSSDDKLTDVQGSVVIRLPWLKNDLDLVTGDALIPERKAQKSVVEQNLQVPLSFENVRLNGIRNLKHMEGDAAQFTMYPQLDDSEIRGVIPEALFLKTTKNVYVPLNFLSAQLATLYAHLERLLAFDALLGLRQSLGTRNVVITSVNEAAGAVNNAFYKSDSDTLIFIPYSDEKMPISINPGIIAHEHFHALFHKQFYFPLVQRKVLPQSMTSSLHSAEVLGKQMDEVFPLSEQTTPSFSKLKDVEKDYTRVLIQGLNEGLADVWGWIYTGRPNFLAMSLPQARDFRNVKAKINQEANIIPFRTQCSIQNEIRQAHMIANTQSKKNDFILGMAYSLGTEYARFFNLYSQILSTGRGMDYTQARIELGRRILSFLPRLANSVEAASLRFTPLDILVHFAQEQNQLSRQECDFFLRTFNAPLNDTDKQFQCQLVDGDAGHFKLRGALGLKVLSALKNEASCR